MSFNDILDRGYKAELAFREKLLESRITRRKQQSNDLKRVLISPENEINLLKSKIEDFNQFSQLDLDALKTRKDYFSLLNIKLLEENRLLEESINNYTAVIDNKKLNVSAKTKELRAKLSVLKNKSADNKFVIIEEFLNLYNLDLNRSSNNNCSVNTEAEVLTLPIQNEQEIEVSKIYISKKSNCIPGNYDTRKNKFIYSIVDKNEDTVFEAFKEGDGPLQLHLSFQFNVETIVNKFKVSSLQTTGSGKFLIEEVKYTDSQGKTLSLRSLVDLKQQKLELLSSKNDFLEVVHLPVKATQVSIVFKVAEYSVYNDLNIFFIGLKSVEFFKQKYISKGEIFSQKFLVQEGFFETNSYEVIYPPKKNTYSTIFNLSTDNGISFSDITNSPLLSDGQAKEILYKFILEKNDSFERINEVFNETLFVDVESQTNKVNREISPSNFYLDLNQGLKNSLKVIQPKIFSRSEEFSKRTIIGVAKSTGLNTFKLPKSIESLKDDEIKVFVGKEEWSRVFDEAELSQEGRYFIKNNRDIVFLISRLQVNLEVAFLINPLIPEVIKKPEGYYIRINENFDYDKNLLEVKCISNHKRNKEIFIQANKAKIFLEDDYIDRNYFVFESYDESQESWIVIDEALYTLDTVNGIISINDSSLLSKEKRLNYRSYNVISLSKEDYEVWVKETEVKGLFLYPEKVSFEEKVESLSNTRSEIYYMFNGEYSQARTGTNTTKSFILSNPNIIKGTLSISDNLFDDAAFKEVAFIDGVSEFLNIKKMQKDYVPRLEKRTTGNVVFSLQEMPYLEGSYSSEFKLFKDEEEITREGVVPPTIDRIMTLPLEEDEAISENYYFSYYYKDSEEEFNAFSVDYENGIIYTSLEVADPESVQVSYKIGNVGVEYYIYNEISNFEHDYVQSKVKVYTEEFLEINNNIKFLLLKSKDIVNLEGLEDYYTPLVYSLKLGLR